MFTKMRIHFVLVFILLSSFLFASVTDSIYQKINSNLKEYFEYFKTDKYKNYYEKEVYDSVKSAISKVVQDEDKLFNEMLVPKNRKEKTFYVRGKKIRIVEFIGNGLDKTTFVMEDDEIVTDEEKAIWLVDLYYAYFSGYYLASTPSMREKLKELISLTDRLMFLGKAYTFTDAAKDVAENITKVYIQAKAGAKGEIVTTVLNAVLEELNKGLKYLYINGMLEFFKETTEETLRILGKDKKDLKVKEIYFVDNYFNKFDTMIEMIVKTLERGYDLKEYGWGNWVKDLLDDFSDISESLIDAYVRELKKAWRELKIKVGRMPKKILEGIRKATGIESVKGSIGAVKGVKKIKEGIEEGDKYKIAEGIVEFVMEGIAMGMYGREFVKANTRMSKRMLKNMYEMFERIEKEEKVKDMLVLVVKALGSAELLRKLVEVDYSYIYWLPNKPLHVRTVMNGMELMKRVKDRERMEIAVKGWKNMWKRMADMPTARGYLSTVVVDGKIYAIGGYNKREGSLNIVEVYDPKTNEWWRVADMPTARHELAAVVVDGKIYAIGGRNPYIRLGTVEVYDPKTNEWKRMSDMPTVRNEIAAAVVGKKIYVIGGRNSYGCLDTVEVYDTTKDSWKEATDMLTARRALAAVSIDGKIYAIGGWNGDYLKTVEVYLPE